MNHDIHKMLQKLEYGLPGLDPIEALVHVQDMNRQLNEYMRNCHFKKVHEEVLFFKVFKPRFLAHSLYHELVRDRWPLRSEQLTGIDQHFAEYYTLGREDLDQLYFNGRVCQKLGTDCSGSGYDVQVAKIMARGWLSLRRTPKRRRQLSPL